MEISDIKDGRWGLSRIFTEPDGTHTTYALAQRLADDVQAFYPPLQAGSYPVGVALVRLRGNIQPTDGDTVLFPRNLAAVGDVTMAELTQQQRTTIANTLSAWLPAYGYVDYDSTNVDKISFADHILTYSGQTTLKEIARDIYRYFGHSKLRYRPPVIETHNTLYTDPFTDDPSPRWTAYGSAGYTWDSGNSEFDISIADDEPLFRYNTSPGSIEHESQVTAVMDQARGVGCGVRMHNSTTADGYGLHVDTTGGVTNILRHNSASRTIISSPSIAIAAGDFATFRMAAEGGNGANVSLSLWYTDHNSTTKPSDPAAFIGDVGSPDATYTDTAVTRLDDASVHLHGGFDGRTGGTDYDTRHCYFRVQAISDRGAAAATSNLTLLGVG